MTFHWSPLPWIALQGGGSTELALNTVLYGLTVPTVGACFWLAGIAWSERGK